MLTFDSRNSCTLQWRYYEDQTQQRPGRQQEKALFAVTDVQGEYDKRMKKGGVFKSGPAKAGSTTIAVFEGTCGNLIRIFEG